MQGVAKASRLVGGAHFTVDPGPFVRFESSNFRSDA